MVDEEEGLTDEPQTASERIHEIYEPKIRQIFDEILAEAKSRGFQGAGPHDMTDEEYCWSLMIYRDAQEDGADVKITIAESGVHEGEGGGINFMLDAATYGGTMLGGVAPYNYTKDVWVPEKDEQAVAARWEIFTAAFDANEIVDSMERHFNK